MPGPRARPLLVRIWDNIDRTTNPDGCWPWTGALREGYARIHVAGRNLTVTRVLLERRIERPLRRSEVARHTCDFAPCCRPDHIIVGSRRDNALDASKRRRLLGNRVGHPFGMVLTDADVVALREAYAADAVTAELAEQYRITPAHVRNIARGRFRVAAGGPLTRRIPDDTEERKAA